jgi:hypothetical protein
MKQIKYIYNKETKNTLMFYDVFDAINQRKITNNKEIFIKKLNLTIFYK